MKTQNIRTLSQEGKMLIRQRAVLCVIEQKKSWKEVVEIFGIGRSSLAKWLKAYRIHGDNGSNFIVENGSEDYELNENEYNIFCDQKILHELNQKIIEKFGQTNFTGLIWKSVNEISVGQDNADTLFKLLNTLEENDDVQTVSSNFDVSDDILASLTA